MLQTLQLLMPSRYPDQEALDRHESSQNYKDFFGQVMAEELLVGTPQMVRGKAVAGFIREEQRG